MTDVYVLAHRSGGQESQIKVSAGWASPEGSVAPSPWVPTLPSLHVRAWRELACVTSSPLRTLVLLD